MAEELKRYPPTPRRLQKLKEAGWTPASAALTAMAVIAGATLGGALGGPHLLAWLCRLLYTDFQSGLPSPEALLSLFSRHLLFAGAVVLFIAAGAGGVAILAYKLQDNFLLHLSKTSYMPMSLGIKDFPRPIRDKIPLTALLIVLGLVFAGVILAQGLQEIQQGLGSARGGMQLQFFIQRLSLLWLRWLAILLGVAVFEALLVRQQYERHAWMTHREYIEEQRETEGVFLPRRGRLVSTLGERNG